MQWNELSYELQKQVYQRLEKTLLEELDPDVQGALVAAIEELEDWDNSPCPIQEDNHVIEPFHACEAQEVIHCCNCIVSWLCGCHCHKKES